MRVEIRPLRESDAAISVHWRNDPAIWRHTAESPDRPITLKDELAWIRRVMADPTSRRFAIVADGTYVGNIYLTDLADGEAEYHVFIGDKAYWGRGVAKRASERLIEFARRDLRLRGIQLRVKHSNRRAVRLYETLGFVRTGTDGEFILMHLHLTPRQVPGESPR